MANNKGVFRRAPFWYSAVGFACFIFGGWVLWANIALTRDGLILEGWQTQHIWPIAWGIAAIEAAVSIFITQPENWDDIWSSLEDLTGGKERSAPPLVGLILSALIVAAVVAMCFGAYAFDFFSTHAGLYPEQAVTSKTGLFTLGYNFGTELLSFFGHQALRLGKVAKADAIQERLEIEPRNVYGSALLRHRIAMAEQQAQEQIHDERRQAQRGGSR